MRHNRSIPDTELIPVLTYDDVHVAAAWLCTAFGFSERLRIGDHRIQLTHGTSAMIARERYASAASAMEIEMEMEMETFTHSILMRVPSVNEHYAHAAAAGVTIRHAPVDEVYGERQYSVVDIGGHVWTFTETLHDSDPASWGGELVASEQRRPLHRYAPYLRCENAAAAIEFYKIVFEATEVVRLVEPTGRIAHAELTLGVVPDASVMLSDEYPERGMHGPRALKGNSVALHLYVDDVVAVCARATAAGGTVTREPTMDAFDDRGGRFLDVCGHEWIVATRVETITNDEMRARFDAFFAT